MMKSASGFGLAGLAAVRITWIIAIVVCVLAVLTGLLSGTDGRNSSRQYPGFAFADGGDSLQPFPGIQQLHGLASLDPTAAPVGLEAQKNPLTSQKTETPGPQGNRDHGVNEQAPADRHPRPAVPHQEGQPEVTGGRPPSSAAGPDRPQAPTVTVNIPKPPQLPTVSVPDPSPSQPPQAPSGSTGPSLPEVSVNVSAPVQTPIVKVPAVSIPLP
jgi:hypothetical protein